MRRARRFLFVLVFPGLRGGALPHAGLAWETLLEIARGAGKKARGARTIHATSM